MMTSGERIYKVMCDSGFNANSLSENIGIHATTLKNWITGTTKPDNLKLDKLCEKLNVNRSWILTGEGDQNRLLISDTKNTPLEKTETNPINNEEMVNRLIEQYEGRLKDKDKIIQGLEEKVADKDATIAALTGKPDALRQTGK